ncbi:hypothetical protein, partial [Sinorhizobium meliloti]|uniref:hypothetical protein n=1 Tax=Rhizobium meliloti TaxID=382 RepID=UPI001AEBD768
MIRTGKMTAQKPYPAERMTLLPVESPSEPFMFGCVRQVLQLDGHACWSCGLTECEFLVLSQVV